VRLSSTLALITSLGLVGCPAQFVPGNPPCEDNEACTPAVLGADFLGYSCRAQKCVVGTCGDGRADEGEECDDGNFDDWDGCDAWCIKRAIRPAPDAGADFDGGVDAGPVDGGTLDGGGADVGLVDSGPPPDAGLIIQPEEACNSEEVRIVGSLKTAMTSSDISLPLLDYGNAEADLVLQHKLSADDDHGCLGAAQVTLSVNGGCAARLVFLPDAAGRFVAQSGFLRADSQCANWPAEYRGTYRMQAQGGGEAWFAFSDKVPGNFGGQTCFGPSQAIFGGGLTLTAIGRPDLHVDFDHVTLTGLFRSEGRAEVDCPGPCGDGLVDAEEACDDGNNLSGDGCSGVCESECWRRSTGTDTAAIPFTGPMTFEGWVETPQVTTLLNQRGLTLSLQANGTVAIELPDGTPFSWSSGEGFSDGPHHIALIHAEQPDRIELYVDGIQRLSERLAGALVYDAEGEARIGGGVVPIRASSVARYSERFVPETSWVADDDTLLLWDYRHAAGPAIDRSVQRHHGTPGTVEPGCVEPATCGDGAVGAGEACDDGNLEPDDGCDAQCFVEGCGDGTVAGEEGCDDGNEVEADGCRNDCVPAVCGDGVLRRDLEVGAEGAEACDDGNNERTDDCVDCGIARCGDGAVLAGVEECDDGNDDDEDECDNQCRNAICGDGLVRGAEECDDENQIDTDNCVDCRNAFCGDNHILEGLEECDDGNGLSGDGCSANTCLAEICGNGRLDAGETCDDGNPVETDDCVDCLPAQCGDGHVFAGEEDCDDGDDDNNDECSNNCEDPELHHVTQISGGGESLYLCGVVTAGVVRCSSLRNDLGQLGNGNFDPSPTPVAVGGISTAEQVAVGGTHACAKLSNGTVRCWGGNQSGQLGNDSFEGSADSVGVIGLSGVASIIAGARHSCARLNSGVVKCWGGNEMGVLGTGEAQGMRHPVPEQVLFLGNVTHLSGRNDQTCATLNDNGTQRAYCWGSLNVGTVYANADGPRVATSPERIADLVGPEATVPGRGHTCARVTGGEIKCFGTNSDGESGGADHEADVLGIQTVSGISGAVELVVSGSSRSCVRFSNGSVRCWGVGIGHIPQAVAGLGDAESITTTGGTRFCAARTNGTVACWSALEELAEMDGW
jgi:cysteine-rich repeat protein